MTKSTVQCPACDGLGVIYWPIYELSGDWLDRFLGTAFPVKVGEEKDDGPCPMCKGSGQDPHYEENTNGRDTVWEEGDD